jgi:hypothetical protein
MRVQPFSFIKEPIAAAPPAGGAPFEDDMLFWFKDAQNNVSGNTWSDSSPANTSTITLLNGTSTSGNAVITRGSNQALRIKPTTNTIFVKSAMILYNRTVTSPGGGGSREYFYDARDANSSSPDNAGFFNQFDSVATNNASTQIHANDATFYAYQEGQTTFNGGTITSQLLTNGTRNSTGGSEWYQWMGPTGRNANTAKTIFFFNYNSNVPIEITTNNEGWYLGSNDIPFEAAHLDYYEVIGYDRALTFDEFEQLVAYLQGTGVIT